MAGKKAFGGYVIKFGGDKTTLEELFGAEPIAPGQMIKKLWEHIKKNKK